MDVLSGHPFPRIDGRCAYPEITGKPARAAEFLDHLVDDGVSHGGYFGNA